MEARIRFRRAFEVQYRRLLLQRSREIQIDRSDRERARLASRDFGQSAADPLNYDVTINTAELTLEAATEVVLTALQGNATHFHLSDVLQNKTSLREARAR